MEKNKNHHLVLYVSIFVVMPILTVLVGRSVDSALGLPAYPPPPWSIFIGVTIFLAGLAMGVSSSRLLIREGEGLTGGEAAESVKTELLVTSGIYGFTRNPMVLGYGVLLFGMGVALQSPGMALTITPLVVAVNLLIVKLREEPDLEARFGEEYASYRDATPLLLPNMGDVTAKVIRPRLRRREQQLMHVGVSLAGLLVLTLLAGKTQILGFSLPSTVFVGAFMVICLLGFATAVKPSGHGGDGVEGFRGHHPSCSRFRGHVIECNGVWYCAGCTGLAVGAVLALTVSGLHFAYGLSLTMPLYWSGVYIVTLGLVQHFIDLGNRWVHLALNVLLVLGCSILMVHMDSIGADGFAQLYFIGVAVFWVASRVRTSQEEHIRVCALCPDHCSYRFT